MSDFIAKNAIEIDNTSGILSDDGSEKSVSALEQDLDNTPSIQNCQEIVAKMLLGNGLLTDEQKMLLNPVRSKIFEQLGLLTHTPLTKKPKKASVAWVLEQQQKCTESDFVDSAIDNSKTSSDKSLGGSFVIINPRSSVKSLGGSFVRVVTDPGSSVSQKPKPAALVVRLEGNARLALGDRRLLQHEDEYVVVDRDGDSDGDDYVVVDSDGDSDGDDYVVVDSDGDSDGNTYQLPADARVDV